MSIDAATLKSPELEKTETIEETSTTTEQEKDDGGLSALTGTVDGDDSGGEKKALTDGDGDGKGSEKEGSEGKDGADDGWEVFDPATISLPEGISLDDETTADFIQLDEQYKFTKEQKEALVAMDVKRSQRQTAAQDATADSEFEKLNADWVKRVKEDPVLGGDNFSSTVANVTDLISAVAGPQKDKDGKETSPGYAQELREVFAFTGAGNHPAVIRFINDLSILAKESGMSPANEGGASGGGQGAQGLYPSMENP